MSNPAPATQVLRVIFFIAGLTFLVARAALGQGPPANFAPAVAYASSGMNTRSIAIGDLNGDGHSDLVVGNGCESSSNCGDASVSVLLGNGDGTFQAPISSKLVGQGGGDPFVAIADLNGDGRQDLVVNITNSITGVGVLLGNGDGTFQGPAYYQTGGIGGMVTVADLNGDSHPDLVVANRCNTEECLQQGGTLGVLMGNGDGSFQTAAVYGAGALFTVFVVVADVNGDGRRDLVAVNGDNGTVSVLLGNGDGTFQKPVNYSSGYLPTSVAIADVNGDGHLDLAVANACQSSSDCTTGTVSVLLGNGDGTFQSPVSYSSGGFGTGSIAIADVNGDGYPDLAVVNGCRNNRNVCTTGTVSVLLGNGDGTFQAPVAHLTGGVYAQLVTIADLDGDGRLDLAVANQCGTTICVTGTVGVLLNSTQVKSTAKLTTSSSPWFIHQPVTFTATITPKPLPEGQMVTFYDGTTEIGTGSILSGVATFTTSSLSAKSHTIKASYPGDPFEKPSSGSVTQVVTLYPSDSAMTSSLDPSIYGQAITFSATVAGSGPFPRTGKVSFKWSDHNIGTSTLNSSGVATVVKYYLGAGAYPVTAVYTGDTNNQPSTSAVVNQIVEQARTTTALASSPNPSTFGQAVTFRAKVTSSTVIPQGSVTFTVGATTLGTVTLSGGGARLVVSSLPAGSHTVKVAYRENVNILGSSASITQVVH